MIYTNKVSGLKYIDIISDEHSEETISPLPVVSLFSGAGGLDIGLEQAGFTTSMCVEIDADCRETLRANRPEWRLFESTVKRVGKKSIDRVAGDVRMIDPDEIIQATGIKKGDYALVVGGAPCQPFSNIGKKQGKNDEKNGDLFLEFVRMVKGLSPKAFIFENVAGITQSKHEEVINYMIQSFEGLNYGVSCTILNAADYGVPQKRERFILIGIKNIKQPAFPLPTYAKNNKSWETFISNLEVAPSNGWHKWKTVKEAFKQIPKVATKRNDFVVMNISDKVVERMTYIKQGENFKVLPSRLRPNCWKNGKHQGVDTFGRLKADEPSVTIRTAAYNPSKGKYIHPTQNRGLNSMEMAALQDFPYDWQFKRKDSDKLTLVSGGKQIGNAVPPGLGKALGLAIKRQIETTIQVKTSPKAASASAKELTTKRLSTAA